MNLGFYQKRSGSGFRVNPWLWFGAKLAITVTIFRLLINRLDLSAAATVVENIEYWPVFFALLSLAVTLIMAALRWRAVIRQAGIELPFGPVLTYQLQSNLFDNLLPAGLGSDAYRMLALHRDPRVSGSSISAVLLDRVATFASLVLLIALGLPVLLQLIDAWPVRITVILATAGGVAVLMLLVAVGRWQPAVSQRRWWARVMGFASAADAVLISGRWRAAVLGWGLACHVSRVLTFWLILYALGVSVEFFALLALIPVALLLAMIPITVGGWGLREALLITALGYAGVSAEPALVASVLYGLTRILMGLAGGTSWLWQGRRVRWQTDADL